MQCHWNQRLYVCLSADRSLLIAVHVKLLFIVNDAATKVNPFPSQTNPLLRHPILESQRKDDEDETVLPPPHGAFSAMIAAQAFLLRMITKAAREGGHIEPFTFTLRLVCGTAKAVVFCSVAHASPTCAGHSQSEVQLGVQFTYLAWDKFGNGRFQRPIPPPHIHINQKKTIWSFVAHWANTPLFILFVLFLVATIPISPSLPFSLVFFSQCQIRAVTLIHSPFDDS